MYSQFELLLFGIAFLILGSFLGHYIGWHLCKAKMDCDKWLESECEMETLQANNAKLTAELEKAKLDSERYQNALKTILRNAVGIK
jgi:hypothetical protein